MPSWNLHTAHVQRLLDQVSACELGIEDVNAFLFGNYVPDINIGYMVKDPSGILPYGLTHFADPEAIPIPREREFWDTYVCPVLQPPQNVPFGPAKISVERSAELNRQAAHYEVPATKEQHEAVVQKLTSPAYRPSDVVLGAWAHLLCDHEYNRATHEWLVRYGVPAGERTRIRKQGDFDLFGRTLPLSLTCEPTVELLRQAGEFPQYGICEADARAAIDAAAHIVRDNQQRHIKGTPDYSLFTAEFFSEVFERVNTRLIERLTSRTS